MSSSISLQFSEKHILDLSNFLLSAAILSGTDVRDFVAGGSLIDSVTRVLPGRGKCLRTPAPGSGSR